jgi:CBS domain containing-hemolysin-like protein
MTIITTLLAVLLLLLVSINRTYSHYPLKELKRRAREGDEIAESLVRAAGYGHSTSVVLWFVSLLVSAVLFVQLSMQAPTWFAFTSIAALLWLGFVWLPAARISAISERLAALLAPIIARVVSALHPLIDKTVRFIDGHRPIQLHTGMYDKDDLLELLETQKVIPENRIEKTELELAMNALKFGDHTIGQHMTPRRVVKMVSVEDQLGPIVMDELHASGHSRFPVYQGAQDTVVGTLYLHDLMHMKTNATARSVMRPSVYYLHEDQTLYDALQALLITHHHLFIVVNEFEEFVGVLSSEDILEVLIGKPLVDEFDKYDNLREVAARAAKKEHKEHKEVPVPTEELVTEEETETTTEESTEVIK